MKKQMLLAYDAQGKRYQFKFWRDTLRPAYWMLEDYTGYVRTLETTWLASVPRIRLIVANHGMTCEVS